MSVRFTYKALDGVGQLVRETVEAPSKEEALEKIAALREHGLNDIQIESAEVIEQEVPAPVPTPIITEIRNIQKCCFCLGEIPQGAQKCQHCGEWLKGNKKQKEPKQENKTIVVRYKNPAIAFFLGLLGWGQVYNGQLLKWFIFWALGWILLFTTAGIGCLILYPITIVDAYWTAKRINAGKVRA